MMFSLGNSKLMMLMTEVELHDTKLEALESLKEIATMNRDSLNNEMAAEIEALAAEMDAEVAIDKLRPLAVGDMGWEMEMNMKSSVFAFQIKFLVFSRGRVTVTLMGMGAPGDIRASDLKPLAVMVDRRVTDHTDFVDDGESSRVRQVIVEAETAMQEGRILDAVALYDSAIALDSAVARARGGWVALCATATLWGYATHVGSACDRAVDLRSSEVGPYWARALYHSTTGDPASAVTDLETLFDRMVDGEGRTELTAFIEQLRAGETPFSVRWRSDRIIDAGQALRGSVALELVLRYNERAIAVDSTNATAQSNIGYDYMQLGQLDRALQELERAYALDSTRLLTRQNLGAAYRKSGDFEAALEWHEAARAVARGDQVLDGPWKHSYSIGDTEAAMMGTVALKTVNEKLSLIAYALSIDHALLESVADADAEFMMAWQLSSKLDMRCFQAYEMQLALRDDRPEGTRQWLAERFEQLMDGIRCLGLNNWSP